MEINIYTHGPDNYEFYTSTGYYNIATSGNPLTLNVAPGGGQTFPAKFVFDVTATPSCTNGFVVIGIPANPAAGASTM